MDERRCNGERRSALSAGALLWLVPLLLLAALVYISLAAFAGHAQPQVPVPTATPPGAFPRIINADGGRQVLIPARPVRIVPCNAGTADIVAALVAPSRIAAVPALVLDYAGARDFYRQHAEIKRFEKFDAETLLVLDPDLVLASAFQDAAATLILEQRGIPVMSLDQFQTLAGIRASFMTVGAAVGDEQKALALAEDFDRRLADVERACEGLPRPRVLAYANYGVGFAVGSGESQDEILRRAGALNAAAAIGLRGHQPFTFEQVLNLDPDFIVVMGDEGLDSAQARLLLNEPALAGLRSIRERHIAVIPDRYFAAVSQYAVNAVELLARQFHPSGSRKGAP